MQILLVFSNKKKFSFSRYSQINALHIACAMGMESCRELVKSWYRQWMKNPNNNPWVVKFPFVVSWDFFAACVNLPWKARVPASQTCMCVWGGGMGSFFLTQRIFSLTRRRIHPNLKSTVYCNAIAFGGAEEWDFAWRMFKSATLASEASRLRSAMACTKVPWLLNRYVNQPK